MSEPNATRVLETLLEPEADVRRVEDSLYSVLPPHVTAERYETRAAAYDRVVGSWLYNRLVWGLSTDRYSSFVQDALACGSGPALDIGAGSAVFTTDAYLRTDRHLILVDRSRGMLEAARKRLARTANGSVPSHITLLQGDLVTLPVREGAVETAISMGVLHLFEDLDTYLEPILQMLDSGGSLFATSLVAEQGVGHLYLRLLYSAGEVASPRTYDELRRDLSKRPAVDVDATRAGSMAFLRIRKR